MPNLLDLSDKTILITGGAGAIGRVVVDLLAAYGAVVVANDVISAAEAHVALPAAANVHYIQADVTDPGEVERLYAAMQQTVGLPNVVCCHAGMVGAYPVDQYPLDEFDSLLNLNMRSSFLIAQAAAKHWMAAGTPGLLLFTTSWVQDVPWPEIAPYSASKAAMKALMRSFARELAPHRIRANAIAPGIVGVGMARRQWDTDPSYQARARKAIPLGHLQTPESVAHAFLYLCSPLAAYMTGSVLLVDGGCSLYPMDE